MCFVFCSPFFLPFFLSYIITLSFSLVLFFEVIPYLPSGTWYDWNTGERLESGRHITADTPLDVIPLYVRAGTVITSSEPMQYADEIKNPVIKIAVYPGSSGEFSLYFDDGETYDYEKGVREKILISWNDAENTLILHDRDGGYPEMPEVREFEASVISGGSMKKISYRGRKTEIVLR